jgi:hypothetical protein
MATTALEARQTILRDLAVAVDRIGLAIAALGDAFEQLPEAAGERLEGNLFRPAQRAYAQAKRTHSGFAERHGLANREFDLPSPGPASQGAAALVGRAVEAVVDADRRIAELQDSMLPVESGDAELRSGLAEVRETLAPVPVGAREFLRVLGR